MDTHSHTLPHLTVQQSKSLELLQGYVAQELPKILPTPTQSQVNRYSDRDHLIRLLIGKDWNIKQSQEQWKRWVEWRLAYQADNILESEIEPELKSGKAFWHGKDKLGNPCLIVKARKHFPGQSSQEMLIRYFLYLMDIGMKLADDAGTGKITVIWDRDGVTSKNFDSSMLAVVKKILTMVQDNYAERLQLAIVLYPNWLVKSIMAVTMPFLSEKTRSKLKRMSTKEELREYFDEENLLVEHGGKSEFVYSWASEGKRIEKQASIVQEVDEQEEAKMKELGEQLLKEHMMDAKDIE